MWSIDTKPNSAAKVMQQLASSTPRPEAPAPQLASSAPRPKAPAQPHPPPSQSPPSPVQCLSRASDATPLVHAPVQASTPILASGATSQEYEIGLFWDYENIALPSDQHVSEASNRLRKVALHFGGRLVERRVYHDPAKLHSVAVHARGQLDASGFTLVDCPTRNAKETIDKKVPPCAPLRWSGRVLSIHTSSSTTRPSRNLLSHADHR